MKPELVNCCTMHRRYQSAAARAFVAFARTYFNNETRG